MVKKERKPQFGATNLTARSDASASSNKSKLNSSAPTKFHRSWTHKLISPDEYNVSGPNIENLREIDKTATWLPMSIHERDFKTNTTISYRDPRDVPVKVRKIRTTKEIEHDNRRAQEQKESVDSLCKLARKCYGTTGAMLKTVRG